MEVRQIDPNVAEGRRKGSRLTLQENPLHAVEGFRRIGKGHFILYLIALQHVVNQVPFEGVFPFPLLAWSIPESADSEHAED